MINQDKKIELFLTGCGSSGTKYISVLLNKNGFDVGHDFYPIGKMGFVSNQIVNDEVWVYYRGQYPKNEKISLSKFSNIIHIVRHPLSVIASVMKKWQRRGAIWPHVKEGPLASEKDKSISILNAMKYWLYQNQHVMKYTNKIVKFEDVLEDSNALGKYLNTSNMEGIDKKKKINASNTNIKIDWDKLFKEDKHITNEIIKLCNTYGYETPTD
jgi:hypothetical protein